MSTDGRGELGRRVRAEAPLVDAAVVIRGGPDTLPLLSTHARRLHRAFVLDGEPVFEVSVFVALDDPGPASERGILSGKLRTYRSIYRSTMGELLDRGMTLLPTFVRPRGLTPLVGVIRRTARSRTSRTGRTAEGGSASGDRP